MFYKVTLDLSPLLYPELVDDLLAIFPDCKGPIHGDLPRFVFVGSSKSTKFEGILTLIKSLGYAVNSGDLAIKPLKKIAYTSELIYEESDFRKALLIRGLAEKFDDEIESITREGRLKVSVQPPPFKFCFGVGHFIVKKLVKERLEEQRFKGLVFLPVDHIPGDWRKLGPLPKKQTPLEHIFGLTTTAVLPKPNYAAERPWPYTEEEIANLSESDLYLDYAEEPTGLVYRQRQPFLNFSNRLCQFWRRHFGEVAWSIVASSEVDPSNETDEPVSAALAPMELANKKNYPDHLEIVLQVMEQHDVPIWDIWLHTYWDGGYEGLPEADMLKESFKKDPQFREKSGKIANEIVKYCLDEQLVEVYESKYPDGELVQSTAKTFAHSLFVRKPKKGGKAYHFSITEKGKSFGR